MSPKVMASSMGCVALIVASCGFVDRKRKKRNSKVGLHSISAMRHE
jgi:hypothetical protein